MRPVQNSQPLNAKFVLWSLAAEPLFLAALAYFLRRSGALQQPARLSNGDPLLVIFATAALAGMWASFQFASGRFAPKPQASAPESLKLPFGHQIVAVALATMPGILGFVHHLLYGADWVLLLFNLGALALAAKHIMSFQN